MPGRIITGFKSAGVKNPLILLDEIDKISSDYKGDTASALLEVLDSEQNSHFIDHYIELPTDLSQVLFIATANDLSDVSRPLLDRMEIIEISSYTKNEKMHIAKEHLIPKQLEKNGLTKNRLKISDKALDTDEILNTLGLSDHADKKPNQLSGGQQQRTSIGRALIKNPDILLCDEPTGALDYNTSKDILKLIEDVNKKYGNTIIIVTHNDAIKNMADRVITLRDGRIRKNYVNDNKIPAADLEW